METNSLLRVQEVAQILGISRSKAYQLVQKRIIPAVVFGKSVRVLFGDLQGFIASHREPADHNQ